MHTDKVLAVIPARGGSQELPRKNVLPVGGKPLINWTIEAALRAELVDRVVLSSDDEEIIKIGFAAGCDVPFRRPAKLADNKSTSIDVILHTLEQITGYDYIVLLQPTSPLRTNIDIDSSIELIRRRNAPACVAVTEVENSPYWMYRVNEGNTLQNIIDPLSGVNRRQDLPTIYTLNGAIYIAKIDWLLETKTFICPETIAYKMPKDRSIDIDDMEDYQQLLHIVEAR